MPARQIPAGGTVTTATRKQRVWLIAGGIAVVLLTAAVFTLGSLSTPFHPEQGNEFLVFFALSTFLGAALLVFGLILLRSLVRMATERRAGQMGSRFKTKMVLGAMGVSLLPVVFMFFFSYALVNRTLNAWFPRPLELANEESQLLLQDMRKTGAGHLGDIAAKAARSGSPDETFLQNSWSVDASWIVDPHGAVSHGVAYTNRQADALGTQRIAPQLAQAFPGGTEFWRNGNDIYLVGSAPLREGKLYVARKIPGDYLQRVDEIQTQTDTYDEQKQHLRAYKREILGVLSLITLLLLFATTWVALFLSKQVTVPIQALAEATREISRGNFDQRIEVQAQDELGTLVRSFNRMTEQLGEGLKQINEFTKSLEQAIEERERRRNLMETILEDVPTGVVSLDASGDVVRVNSAVITILGESARRARSLSELVGDEAARAVLHLMRRSLRMGAASREIEIAAGGRLVRAAVTVSSLGPRRSNPGFVVVIDDLTELLQAQKAAAWQEVAQRIAHEIKNPLTPIQLSAQRLLRHLDRASSAYPGFARSELERLVAECAGLIEREVQTLSSLVNEFSQFARFPAARLAPANVNSIVEGALGRFDGRLEGIMVSASLAPALPPIRADAELMGTVLANLIDNAAEAMEGTAIRRLNVGTRAVADGDAVEIEIADSGHGVSPEDKERLFLPHFSTKGRGTGLGLAIASRIVAEHNGTIRIEDNSPVGARFVMRFP